ncbi:unnamed protein product [Diamesa tonsa]
MKFVIGFIVLCCISNIVNFKIECKDSESLMLVHGNTSVYLIHSYGLNINHTLTKKQKSLFLIEENPIDQYLFISESKDRRGNQPVHFSVPFYEDMKKVQMKPKKVARCGRYMDGYSFALLTKGNGFGNYIFFYGCNVGNGFSMTILLMDGYFRNHTAQELTSYFNMTHQVHKYQVKNHLNTGFCTCIDTNSVNLDCIQDPTPFGTIFFWIFTFIFFFNAVLMYAFDYLTDFKDK